MKHLPAVLFVLAVALANIITAATTPFELGPYLVTWGTLFAGATFVLRDLVQLRSGRRVVYTIILLGLITAAVTSALLGDTLAIVVASAVAIGVGETLDTEVFSRWRGGAPSRVLLSGLIGGTVDTVLFVVIGLSPLWSGILPWSAVDEAIIGVALVKAAMQVLGACGWWVVAPEPVSEPA